MNLFQRIFGKRPEKTPEPAPPRAPDGFRDGIEGFCWQVLVNAYVRVLARQAGRDPMTIPPREVNMILEPYHADLERDVRALAEAIVRARHEGVSRAHAAIHRIPGIDHEMVDQSLAFTYSGDSKAK